MGDIKTESANFVIAHLLTKEGQLSTNDVRVIQTGLLETNNANFDFADGGFGSDTGKSTIKFLGHKENLHLVPRLSDAVRKALVAQEGGERQLANLEKQALEAGHDPNSIEGDTVKSLISQPYPLSDGEVKFLKTELYKAGFANPIDDEFIIRADNNETVYRPDGVMRSNVLFGVANYIEKNPDAVLENPAMIDQMLRNGSNETIRGMAVDSKTYKSLTDKLVENHTGPEVSTLNYRLQLMLKGGSYLEARPDGAIGDTGLKAIEEFKTQSGKQGALQGEWNRTEHAAVDEPAADAQIPPPKLG